MIFNISKIRTYFFCPKKFFLESKNESFDNTLSYLPKKGKENISLAYDFLGVTLVVKNVEIIIGEKITIISRRRGKRLYQYHYLEAAGYAYVVSKFTNKEIEVIFKSNYYNVKMPWEKYINSFQNAIQYFSENNYFRPKLNPECKFCKYSFECTNELMAYRDISLIRGIGKYRLEKLKEYGINTLDDLVENQKKS